MKTNDEMLNLLREEVERRGSQKAVAEWLGITQGFLGDILHGRAPVTADVAEKLGYRKSVVFIKDKR